MTQSMGVDKKLLISTTVIAISYTLICPIVHSFGTDFTGLCALIAVIPTVAGIVCGRQSVIGMLIGSTLSAVIIGMSAVNAVLFIIVSVLTPLCAYKCFQGLKKEGSNEYVYNSRSLMGFLLSIIIATISFNLIIGNPLMNDGRLITGYFKLIIFDSMSISLFAGIVILFIISAKYHGPFIEHSVHNEKWRCALYALLPIPILIGILASFVNIDNWVIVIVSVLCIAVFGLFGPTARTVYDENELHSVNSRRSQV